MSGRTRLAALGIGALAIAGCGSSKTETVTVNQPAAGATSAATTTTASSTSGSNHGALGDTLTVKGQTKDLIAVTAKDIQDPAHGYDPDPGKRVLGVQFTVKNVGEVLYKDFPSAQVTTADGESSGSAISVGGSCNSPSTIKLRPGESRSFCLPFQVAKAGKIKTIQYEPDSGYGTPAVFVAKK